MNQFLVGSNEKYDEFVPIGMIIFCYLATSLSDQIEQLMSFVIRYRETRIHVSRAIFR
jgi:hypothetical protein